MPFTLICPYYHIVLRFCIKLPTSLLRLSHLCKWIFNSLSKQLQIYSTAFHSATHSHICKTQWCPTIMLTHVCKCAYLSFRMRLACSIHQKMFNTTIYAAIPQIDFKIYCKLISIIISSFRISIHHCFVANGQIVRSLDRTLRLIPELCVFY